LKADRLYVHLTMQKNTCLKSDYSFISSPAH
jgi:hypothetical protein